jgi:crotonobetainyl-CoA:carnitine CoA-transferase CaiB-like acyl-CoA transferase
MPHTEAAPKAQRPLEGLRVIDLTTVLMGPFATQTLGDMGADVIKVEAPGGDNVRAIGPSRNPGMGPIFLNVNRSKRSIVLDLKQPAGREALLRLCKDADILVYNIRPQAMARLGLAYEALSEVNPRLIYAGMVGYDPRGPYAARPAYDDLIQGAIGLPSLAVAAGSDEPRYVPLTVADYFVGITGTTAILGALHHRERTGRGQELTIPMFETMAQLVLAVHLGGRSFEPPIGKAGYSRLLAPQRKPYRTQDGYVCALIYNDKQCESFFRAVGKPQLFTEDPRFATITARTEHISELYALVEEVLATRTTAEWVELLERADIPVMALNDLDGLIDDPHLAATGLVRESDHPTEGRLRSIGVPTRWSETQPAPSRPAPRLGEHSVEVLRECGYSDAAIAELVECGAVQMPA